MDDEDYQLRWPLPLFQSEVARLLNNRDHVDDWTERCAVLLEDAFSSICPATEFLAIVAATKGADPWSKPPKSPVTEPQRWLADLLRRAPSLPYEGQRRLYFSERASATSPSQFSLAGAVHEYQRLIVSLTIRGYLEQAFGKDCVDDPREIAPSVVIMARLPREGLWPIQPELLVSDVESFYDLIEVVHDLVAAPRYRTLHNYGGCGIHYADFSTSIGRSVYRWSVNRILERTDLRLRLADEGEDRGRLVGTTDSAREELLARMGDQDHDITAGEVPHAISLFRSRGATPHDKLSACLTLAGVLEERRGLMKASSMSRDEGDLFTIANKFGIRHKNAAQQRNYDPMFLGWIFWFYLGAIELTNNLIARDEIRAAGPATH